MLGIASATAAGTSGGPAIIVDPASNQPLASGGSQTTWTFALPPQAHCTKDTATFAYHWFAYIVPSSVDPASLTFTSSGPSTGNPLYDSNNNPIIAKSNAPKTGQVIELPLFNWALFSPDGAAGITNPNSAYNVGIACATNTGEGDVFWNVVVTFAASTSDPNHQTWTAANSVTTTTTTSSTVAGATTTTSSTVAGATTTTSSTVAGATTTTSSTVDTTTTSSTVAGDTTSTSSTLPGGSTTSSSSTTSSTVPGSSTTTTSSTVAGASAVLALTGAAVRNLYFWGFLLIVVGLAISLFTDRRRRRRPGRMR